MKRRYISLCAVLLCSAWVSAQTISGTVTNATTNTPAAGDPVALLSLSQGMNVTGESKTDAEGKFTFMIKDAGVPHLIRVTHAGISYFPEGGPVNPGTSTANITVFDTAKKLPDIATNVDVIRLQSEGAGMQVVELIAVKNGSSPPKTLVGDRTYEFYLPPGATMEQSSASSPGGMPISAAPVPAGEKNKYAFSFPLKPGETRFQMAYRLPYSGEASFSPKFNSAMLHFVVMMPKSMKFEAKNADAYKPLENDPQSTVEVASSVKPGADLAFKISGTGTLVEQEAQAASSGGGAGQADNSAPVVDNRPGGGLGPPVESPDPLHQYRWAILGGLGAVLLAGGVFIVNRSAAREPAPELDFPQLQSQTQRQSSAPLPPMATPSPSGPTAEPANHVSVLLNALKEELFQLELDRQQGKISAEDYGKAKAGLDQTLQRMLMRTRDSSQT